MTSSRMLAVVGITYITVADGLVALATSLITTSMPAIPTFFQTPELEKALLAPGAPRKVPTAQGVGDAEPVAKLSRSKIKVSIARLRAHFRT